MFFEDLFKDIFYMDERDLFPIFGAINEEIDENVIDFDSMTDEEIRSYYE